MLFNIWQCPRAALFRVFPRGFSRARLQRAPLFRFAIESHARLRPDAVRDDRAVSRKNSSEYPKEFEGKFAINALAPVSGR
jgi:hypothetical protein